MLFFDAHCDILSKIKIPQEFFSNNHHWDALRALSNGPFVQVFSLFAEGYNQSEIKRKMEEQLQIINHIENSYPDKIRIIRNGEDLAQLVDDKPHQLGCIIEAEGAEIIGESLEELERLYEAGLRILTLSWNNDNEVCDSIAGNSRHNGLSDFGRKVVEKAEAMGIVIDVSHASDKTFSDIAEIHKKSFIASHSNSRAICSHRRNLTDEQIRTIAKSGGIIGINLFPDFLNNSGNAHLMDIIRHIEYISALVGTSCIGLGCDFDGIDLPPGGIRGVEDMGKIIEELLKLNYSEETVKGIAGQNFKKFFVRELN